MKLLTNTVTLLALTLSVAVPSGSAQFLSNTEFGSLPSCADQCTALSSPQDSCQSGVWSCFCPAVWTQISSAPTQICAETCSDRADVEETYQWYTSNCGTDNGATAHPEGGDSDGSSGDDTADDSGDESEDDSGDESEDDSGSSTSTASASTSSSDSGQSWFEGHWRWVVMMIVLFVGLLGLALLGLWLKKRHHRKRDRINGSFNQGITTRAIDPPMSVAHPGDSVSVINASSVGLDGTRPQSPVRTREAFMPYGYGYTRSDTRLTGSVASNRGGTASPLAHGMSVDDESTVGRATPKRVMVREKSARSYQ